MVLLNQVIKKQETLADSIQHLVRHRRRRAALWIAVANVPWGRGGLGAAQEGKLANCAASPATPAGGSAADRAAKATPEGFVPTSPELDELARQIVEATTNRFGQLQYVRCAGRGAWAHVRGAGGCTCRVWARAGTRGAGGAGGHTCV